MKVLILAGGFATRLWPLTEHRAKPLLLLEGKTILAHILEKIPEEYEIFLLTNKAFENDFQKELQACGRENFQIFCEDAYSDGEKLGALRAVSCALIEFSIKEDIFIFAGDNILPALNIDDLQCGSDEASLAIREVQTQEEAQKFGVVQVHDKLKIKNYELKENAPFYKGGCPEGRGVLGEKEEGFVEQKNQEIIGFEEKPEHPKSKLVSTGFFSLGKDLFPIMHDFARKSPDALGGIFPELLSHGKTVRAIYTKGDWFDVGSFESYLEAHRKLQNLDIKIGKNVSQTENQFSGKVFLGEGCSVKNCHISDSIIYPHCRLENCYISQSVLDTNCHLEGLDLNRKLVRTGTEVKGE